ncbi:protein STRUBBELIG-RECEPTOR FAMILY 3-like [Impatiens glandulifera]|uniref:protein STRUBBELIG-RECEPTOR FAMILY 3-like n=1 Tax=Impatiens glandulifera TaxID=253017 RepID=UPI001FB05A2E|nr:protein STRUBBELIG-RECEPTOR FAMILY 3-like [Impatiens glandulifera]XP_047337206.1 protein STRUBBELIG-RECEPTOR FAMILY 3-like [Impatiens glandulifera]
MRVNKSTVNRLNMEIQSMVFLVFVLICTLQNTLGLTTPTDVSAMNKLYAAFGSPVLPGWVTTAGDPCDEAWQGVQCNNSFVISINLNGANIGGVLSDSLGSFSSIKSIDLGNNHIGGSIPTTLPITLESFSLSSNQLNGSIPSSLSSLVQLSALSLNDNQLSGELPDAFEGLAVLANLDFSSNNLSGPLPPSMQSLSSLTKLNLQNNQLSGPLDVLQDLPLLTLNVENNLFSGPIPDKLSSIPNFKKDGNLFNTTVPSSSPTSSTKPPTVGPSPPFWGSPSDRTPGKQSPPGKQVPAKQPPPKQAEGPTTSKGSNSNSTKKSVTTKRIVWIAIGSALSFVILVMAILLFAPRCRKRRRNDERFKQHEIAPCVGRRDNPRDNGTAVQEIQHSEKVPTPKVEAIKPKEEDQTGTRRMNWISKTRNEAETNTQRMSAVQKSNHHENDMSRFDIDLLVPPPPPVPPPIEKVDEKGRLAKSLKPPMFSVKSYSIASLQLYTSSFSQDNLIGSGMLGSVYRGELPSGKLLAIKKLDKRAFSLQKDYEFLDLVNNIDKIRHANVVELMGYCAEHGERLLIYEYCESGALQDVLHSDDDELKKELSWNARIRMALGAARALEYLHEVCEPPIIHRNFKSSNILLDDEFAVHVSDCGLAPLITAGAVRQLSGQLLSAYGYGAPEFETGVYTMKSDVYSFGVVMLELLTGRKSYDRTRNRGEQFLVRWASHQLHDIDALSRMVDPALNGVYPAKSLSRFADIISRCIQREPEFRPLMSEVVQDIIQMIRRESPNRVGGEE